MCYSNELGEPIYLNGKIIGRVILSNNLHKLFIGMNRNEKAIIEIKSNITRLTYELILEEK